MTKKEIEFAENQTTVQEQYDALYRGVVIDGLLADVRVIASPDGRLRVSYQNECNTAMKLRYRFYQYEEEGVFYAGVEDTGSEKKAGILPYIGQFGRGIYLTVELPSNLPMVKLSTQSGDIKVTDVSVGSLSAETQSGDIELENIDSKKIALQCQSGDIDGKEIRCDELAANAASGDIELERITAETCAVNNASGDIDMAVLPGIKQLALNAASGDISLDLRQIEGATIAANTSSGDLSIHGKKNSGKRFIENFGSGSCKVVVSTSSGDIDIL